MDGLGGPCGPVSYGGSGGDLWPQGGWFDFLLPRDGVRLDWLALAACSTRSHTAWGKPAMEILTP